MTQVSLVATKASKLGMMWASYSESTSCPDYCAYSYRNQGGCYAQSSVRVAGHWNRVTSGKRGVDFESFTMALRSLPRGSLFRHNIAGDLPGKDNRIDVREILMLVKATRHLKSWTYTHKVREVAMVNRLNAMDGLCINLSADTLIQADVLVKQGPTVAVLPSDPEAWPKRTASGVPVVVCPAVRNPDAVTCSTCGGSQGPLCARKNRTFIVGFPAHGIGRKKADKVSKGLAILQ